MTAELESSSCENRNTQASLCILAEALGAIDLKVTWIVRLLRREIFRRVFGCKGDQQEIEKY
jgi:hypothetical protein